MHARFSRVGARPTPTQRGSAVSFDLRRSRARGIPALRREADARDGRSRCSSRALSARSGGSTRSSAAPPRGPVAARARSDASRPASGEVSQQDQSRPDLAAFGSTGSLARCARRSVGSATATPSSPGLALAGSHAAAPHVESHAAALRYGAGAAAHPSGPAAEARPSSEAARRAVSRAARDERRSELPGRPGPPGPSCSSLPRLNCVRWGLTRGEARKKGGPRWPKAA